VNIRLNDTTVTALTAAYDEFFRHLITQVRREIADDNLEPEIDYDVLCERIDASDIADCLNIEASDVAESFTDSDIADEIDLGSLSYEIDLSNVAGHIDLDDLASRIDIENIAEVAYHKVDILLLTSAAHDMVMDNIRMNKWYRRLFRKVKKIVKRNS
tara:strand:+ start:344 stop:817 length:474 start_codon:yes stop_codon:yes gene_type:complete